MRKILILIIALVLFATLGYAKSKINVKSKFRVEMTLNQKVYRMKDHIEGVVKVSNDSFFALPAKFQVQLYQYDDLKYDKSVSFKELEVGITKFDLRDFIVPDLTNNYSSLGKWMLVIYPIDNPDLGDKVKFRIKQR